MGSTAAFAVFKHHRGYFRLFITGIINGMGDRFSQVAMLSLVLQLTGSGMAVGISLGVRVLPFLLLAPLGGVLGGKLPRRAVMIVTDLLRVPVALAFLWVDHPDKVWAVYAASFLLAAGEAIYSPVRKSLIPLLVDRERLLTVNGLEQLMSGIVLVAGAFAGGAVALWFGPQWAFLFNACSFLLAALMLRGITFPQDRNNAVQTEAKSGLQKENFAASSIPLSRALRGIFAGSLILQVVLGFELLVPVVNGLDNVLISVYAIQEYKAGELGVGAFYGALGIGLSLSFLAGRFIQKRLLPGALAALLIEGMLLMSLSFNSSFIAAIGLYILLSFAGGIGSACLDTLLMKEVPGRHQPVVFGLLAAVSSTLLGLSMFGAGLLLESMEPRRLGLWGGAGFVIIALMLSAYTLMHKRMNKKKDDEVTVPWKLL